MNRPLLPLFAAPLILAPLLAAGASSIGAPSAEATHASEGTVAVDIVDVGQDLTGEPDVAAAPQAARLQAVAPGLSPKVLDRALAAHACATAKGDLAGAAHPDRLTVIDYALPSSEERLWVFDLDSGELLFHELVAHGQGSGALNATKFSNTDSSHQSSLGVFRTAETYVGKHGRSLRLDGLEAGVNDLARDRAIVIHGADYVSEGFVDAQGRLGRSWGCPAVNAEVSDALIDAIGGGSLVFSWYPEDAWLSSSAYLDCGA